MQVCWDEAKNLANQKKHGISFNEAQELFLSGNFLKVFGDEHSETEERFIAIGLISRGLVVVVWTESEENNSYTADLAAGAGTGQAV